VNSCFAAWARVSRKMVNLANKNMLHASVLRQFHIAVLVLLCSALTT
jgi:hypothetical protein